MKMMRGALIACFVAAAAVNSWTVVRAAEGDRKSIEQLFAKYLQSVNDASLPIADQIWSHSGDVDVVTPFGRFQGWDSVRKNVYVDFLQKAFSERRLEGTNVAIRMSGDSASLVYDWVFTAKLANGQPISSKGWESHIYQRTRQGWRIVGLHYSVPPPPMPQPSTDTPAFVAFYWRAKPGKLAEYNDYIKNVAEPIDEDARQHGVFEEIRTVMPAPGTTTDWTHLRIFRVKNLAATETFQAGMDAATARVVSDESKRKANSERSATLRDAVRREVWTELK